MRFTIVGWGHCDYVFSSLCRCSALGVQAQGALHPPDVTASSRLNRRKYVGDLDRRLASTRLAVLPGDWGHEAGCLGRRLAVEGTRMVIFTGWRT